MAAGRRDRLGPRRRPKGRIADSRIAGLIAGVANHEARMVFDARVARLREALARGDEARLERALCEVRLLALWRARNLTGFDALAQDVLGLETERAAALAERGASARGVALERLPDVAVALWLRSEAALLTRYPAAELDVRLESNGEQLLFSLRLPLAPKIAAADAFAAIGRSAAGLVRVLEGDQPGASQHPRDPKGPRST